MAKNLKRNFIRENNKEYVKLRLEPLVTKEI
jgi:hypothetical protein